DIPAPTEGLACVLNFVRDEARCQECEGKLTRGHLKFYLNWVGLLAMYSGHYELALHYYDAAKAVARNIGNAKSLSAILQNESELLTNLGQLAEAQRTATEAFLFATYWRDSREI